MWVLFQQFIVAVIVQGGFFAPVKRWVDIHWGIWEWKSPRLGYVVVATHARLYIFLHLIVHMVVSRSTQALSGKKKKDCWFTYMLYVSYKARWLGNVMFCYNGCPFLLAVYWGSKLNSASKVHACTSRYMCLIWKLRNLSWWAVQLGAELSPWLVQPYRHHFFPSFLDAVSALWNIPLVFLFSFLERPPVAFVVFIAFYGTCNSGVSLPLHNRC